MKIKLVKKYSSSSSSHHSSFVKRNLSAAATLAVAIGSIFFVPTEAEALPEALSFSRNVSANTKAIYAQSDQLGSDDPSLQQSVTADEKIVPEGESVVFDNGHADMGPVFLDDSMRFLVRDDRETPPVWRDPRDIVFRLSESAAQVLPEGSDFDFTGATGGDKVWVVPQTQMQDVPWLGWNTQAPSVVQSVDRGVTFEFLGHQGPGQFSVFLQNGGFDQAQQLWNSGSSQKQSTWVDLNTHTHANWVFTEPGVHLVAMNVKAVQLDGNPVNDIAILRFAVGDADPNAAANAQWKGELRVGDDGETEDSTNNSGTSVVLWVSVGLIIVAAILIGLGLRNRRSSARRKAAARKSE